MAGTAKLKGNRLIVKTKCKGKPKGRCLLNLQAKLKKRGPAVTNKRTVRVRAGKKRKASLDVKGKFLADLTSRAANGKKIVIRQKLRKGGKVTKGFVKVRVKLT